MTKKTKKSKTEKVFIINDHRPFCLYKNKEIGLSDNCFSGVKFKETTGNEYITDVIGESFGWIDNRGFKYRDNKHYMTRPTIEQITEELNNSPKLLEISIEKGYVTIIKKEIEQDYIMTS